MKAAASMVSSTLYAFVDPPVEIFPFQVWSVCASLSGRPVRAVAGHLAGVIHQRLRLVRGNLVIDPNRRSWPRDAWPLWTTRGRPEEAFAFQLGTSLRKMLARQ